MRVVAFNPASATSNCWKNALRTDSMKIDRKTLPRDRDSLRASVESLTLNHALPDSLLQGTIEYGVGLLKPEFREEPLGSPEWLKKAALFGFHLGRLDRNRIGENPPVALGAHRKALVELFNNNFSVDSEEVGPTKSACLNIIEAAFYTSRRFDLQI